MLAESYMELNDIHSRSVIIPPQNQLSVTLSRDPTINILSLLFPLNANSTDLHKKKFSTAELAELLTFSYSSTTEVVKRYSDTTQITMLSFSTN